MFNFISRVIDALYPSVCIMCDVLLHKTHDRICASCNEQIALPAPRILGDAENTRVSVYRALPYTEPFVSLVRAKNYHRPYGALSLGALTAQRLENTILNYDAIIPIPLHWTRLWWRTFNQATFMAQMISKRTGIPVCKVLWRKKATRQQAELSASDRRDNLAGAFSVFPEADYKLSEYRSVLLVDDVCTSGATLEAAARVIKKKFPHLSVACITACSST